MKEEKRWISSEALFSAIEELLAGGRQAVFTVTGMSMWPFLCHGRDQVVVERCAPHALKKGDIVLLKTQFGSYLLHRITKVTASQIVTTGDGNCFRDGAFSRAAVQARVVRLIRKGRSIDCASFLWKLIFRLWMLLFPARPFLLRLLVQISRTKQHITQRSR